MATTTKKTNKSGQTFYEIRVHISRDRPTLTKRWYPPKGWSQRTIDRELAKVAAEFERKIAGGEVLSRAERKAQALPKPRRLRRYRPSGNMASKCSCPRNG